jgi:hypothetical protein
LEEIAQFYVCGNFYDCFWVISLPILVGVGSQQKCSSALDRAGNDADRDTPTVFGSLESNDLRGQGIFGVELEIQSSGIENHSGLALIVVLKLTYPVRKAAHAGDNSSSQHHSSLPHIFSISKEAGRSKEKEYLVWPLMEVGEAVIEEGSTGDCGSR